MEGYLNYNDYTDPAKIKAHAEWDLMSEDNFFRLDTPQLTITGDVIDLSKLALDDTVHVQEKDIISFYGDSYQADANGNYSTPYARIVPWVDAYDDHIKGINIVGGEFCIEGSPVATKQDIAELKRQIKILRDNMS